MNKHFQYALNDDDEDYLDPNDLEIINDETWEPTDEDIFHYASKLGFDIENDPDELFEIAYSFLKYPIPLGWNRVIYKQTRELMYMNMETGEIEGITEVEEMARQVYEERKNEMIKRGLIHTSTNDNKVVPNKKIPPITRQSTGNADKSSMINKDNGNDMSRSCYDDDNDDDDDSEDSLKQNLITSKNKATTSVLSARTLQNMKKEYLDLKLNELKVYEKQLKDNYYKTIKAYKNKKEELLLTLSEENKKRFQKEKDKMYQINKNKLKLYITQLENTNKKQLTKYKKEIDNEYKTQPPLTEQNENDNIINTLQLQKQNLQNEINRIKTQQQQPLSKATNNNIQNELTQKKSIIDNKHNTTKNNIQKEYDMKLKEFQIEKEKEFTSYINKTYTHTSNKSSSNLNSANEKDFQEEYNINCKKIENEYKLKHEQELNEFKLTMNKHTQNQIKEIRTHKTQLENDYFIYITKLREDTNKLTNENDMIMKNKLDLILDQYDIIKNNIIENDNKQINIILTKIKELIVNMNESQDIECKIEECLMNIYDEHMFTMQKMKNEYDLVEKEFIYIMCVIEYVIDVVGFFNKAILEKNMSSTVNTIGNDNDNNDKCNDNVLIDSVFDFAKDKVEQYRSKYQQDKARRLYTFLKANNDNVNKLINQLKLTLSSSKKVLVEKFNDVSNKETHNNIDNNNNKDDNSKFNFVISEEDNEQNSSHHNEQQQQQQEQPLSNNNNNKEEIYNDTLYYNHNYKLNNKIDVPFLEDSALQYFNKDELNMYTEIVLFLKKEYIKIEELKHHRKKIKINTKLYLLILNKIKSYTEDTFDYIQSKIKNKETINNNMIKDKLNLLITNINDYKKNFYIDLPKMLSKRSSKKKKQTQEHKIN